MKKLKILSVVCTLALLVAASATQAHEANAQVDVNVGASVNVNTGNIDASAKGNATSSVKADKEDKSPKAKATSSTSTSVKGNATSSAAKDKNGTTTGSVGAEHRSEVATFVQNLLNSADRLWGIVEQVRVIARDQASSSAKISASVEELESRGSVKTFFVGTDYKNVGEIRSELAQSASRLGQLERELQKVGSTTDAARVAAEIDTIVKSQAEIEAFLKAEESKFSLFGWFAKLVQ